MLALCLVGAVCQLASADVTIISNGKSDYAISIPVNASPPVRLAAEEIVRYVKQMSGATLEIKPGELSGKAILLMPAREAGAATQILIDENKIVIGGNDRDLLGGAY